MQDFKDRMKTITQKSLKRQTYIIFLVKQVIRNSTAKLLAVCTKKAKYAYKNKKLVRAALMDIETQ